MESSDKHMTPPEPITTPAFGLHCGYGSCDKAHDHLPPHRCRCGKHPDEPGNGCAWHTAGTHHGADAANVGRALLAERSGPETLTKAMHRYRTDAQFRAAVDELCDDMEHEEIAARMRATGKPAHEIDPAPRYTPCGICGVYIRTTAKDDHTCDEQDVEYQAQRQRHV
jgi:hypothetical protein